MLINALINYRALKKLTCVKKINTR